MTVAHEGCYLFDARVAPYVDLILGVAVSADQLVHVFAEGQVAYLGASVLLAEELASEDVS